MKILIIGCGYLGLAAAKHFRKQGHIVTGTTRTQDKFPLLKPLLDRVMLWNKDTIPHIFDHQEVILFTAAPDDASQYRETYLNNAQCILKAMETSPGIRQMIFTSSTSVYGEKKGAFVDENALIEPINPEITALAEAEQLLLSHSKSCIFRLGELIGPHRTIEMRLRAMQGKTLPGAGDSIVNISPLNDVIEALQFAITKPLFGLYNLCSDFHSTRKELYDQICSAKEIPLVKWDATQSTLHTGSKTVNTDKIKKAGYRFTSSLWEGIISDDAYSARST